MNENYFCPLPGLSANDLTAAVELAHTALCGDYARHQFGAHLDMTDEDMDRLRAVLSKALDAASKPQSWRMRVRQNWCSLEELREYDRMYGLAARCGFASADAMWAADPWVGGAVDPAAFGLARREHDPERDRRYWLVCGRPDNGENEYACVSGVGMTQEEAVEEFVLTRFGPAAVYHMELVAELTDAPISMSGG